jgi:hypothetical protein
MNGVIMEGPGGRFVVSRDNQDGIRVKGLTTEVGYTFSCNFRPVY